MMKIHFEKIILATCLLPLAYSTSAAAWLGRLSNYTRSGAAKLTSFYQRGQATLARTRTSRVKTAGLIALGGLPSVYNNLAYPYNKDNPIEEINIGKLQSIKLGLYTSVATWALAFPAVTTAGLLGFGSLHAVSECTQHSAVPKIVKDIIIRKSMQPKPTTEEQVLQGWE